MGARHADEGSRTRAVGVLGFRAIGSSCFTLVG